MLNLLKLFGNSVDMVAVKWLDIVSTLIAIAPEATIV